MANHIDILKFARFVGLSMISKGISVSPLKLQKILYYQQAWHMVFFGRNSQLFDNIPEAWVNGPVYPEVFHQYKHCVPGMCDHLHAKDFGVEDGEEMVLSELKTLASEILLKEDEMRLFDSVINLYGSKTQNQLILATHSEQPWVEAREGLFPYEGSNRKISLDTMYTYYKERHDKKRQSQA